MLNFNSILVFSEDPKALSEFYENVFGKKPEWDNGNYYGFRIGDSYLTIGPHDKIKGISKEPERIMFNFETHDVRGEFERIKKESGAKVIAEPYSMDESDEAQIATFADPDGNYFQLMVPFDVDLSKN